MSSIIFHAHFTASKLGKTALTPTIDIKSVRRSDGLVGAVVTGGSMTENWRGLYYYRLASADLQTYDYEAVAITADATVDLKEVPALWTRWSEAVTVDASGQVTVGSIIASVLSDIGTAAWANGTRTLSSFGTLVSDIATAVWVNNARTLTSFGTLVADIAALVWSSPQRTLTQTVQQIISLLTPGNKITIHRGDDWTFDITGLGDITGNQQIWFTGKRRKKTEPDTEALVQITRTGGLTVLSGGAPSGVGTLSVLDLVAGNLRLTLNAAASQNLDLVEAGAYDIQVKDVGGVVSTRREAVLVIEGDVTRAI